MAFINGSALDVALPTLQQDPNASEPELLWILNAYLLVLATLTPEGGALGDRLGRKRVCMVGIALFATGFVGLRLSPNYGLGNCWANSAGCGRRFASLALIAAEFPEKKRGQAIGTWSAATTLVSLSGLGVDWPMQGGGALFSMRSATSCQNAHQLLLWLYAGVAGANSALAFLYTPPKLKQTKEFTPVPRRIEFFTD